MGLFDLFSSGTNTNLAKQGYTVDRLKPVAAERHGEKFWKYGVPVMQVAR